jgi:hypothetical protein
VVGEGGQVIVQGGAVDGLDGLGHPAVQGHPPARRDPLIQGVPHQGMGEPVTGGGPGYLHDQAGLRRLLYDRDQVLFVVARCLLEDWQLELQPDDGRDPQGPIRLLRQASDTPAHHLPDPLGNLKGVDRGTGEPAALPALDGARLGQVAQHLANEERVAFGLLVDGSGQQQVLVGQRMAGRLLHERSHAGGIESRK